MANNWFVSPPLARSHTMASYWFVSPPLARSYIMAYNWLRSSPRLVARSHHGENLVCITAAVEILPSRVTGFDLHRVFLRGPTMINYWFVSPPLARSHHGE